MNKSAPSLLIRNMVCHRCILTVEQIFQQLNIPVSGVQLGVVSLCKPLSEEQKKALENTLQKVGFELISTRIQKLIEDIRQLVIRYQDMAEEENRPKLSAFISDSLHYDYSYLSDLFSSVEGTTIEQYFIRQRIEKVKELLVYDQLSLTEISYKTGFSSVHHLSSQFRKVTGFTPSHFRKIGANRRQSIDRI